MESLLDTALAKWWLAFLFIYFCGDALAKQQKVYRGEPWRADCHLGLVVLLGKKGGPRSQTLDGRFWKAD